MLREQRSMNEVVKGFQLGVPEPSRGFGQLLSHAFEKIKNLIGADVLQGSLCVNRIEPVEQEGVALDGSPFMI